jgi:hypothetical protein
LLCTAADSTHNKYQLLLLLLLLLVLLLIICLGVIVGGGFARVETAGEIKDFIRDSAKDYYHNINSKNIRIVIIQSRNRLFQK